MSKTQQIFQLHKEFEIVLPYSIETSFLNLENYNENRNFWYAALVRPSIHVRRVKYRQAYEVSMQGTSKTMPVRLEAEMERTHDGSTLITGQVKIERLAVALLILLTGLGLLANIMLPLEVVWWLRFILFALPILGLRYIQYQFDKLILTLQDAILLQQKKHA